MIHNQHKLIIILNFRDIKSIVFLMKKVHLMRIESNNLSQV